MFSRSIVGAILKAARRARGVRQGALAEELGMSQAALSHVESGRNAASQKVLEVYARRLVGPQAAPEFIELLNTGTPSSLARIAELVAPSNPKLFEATVDQLVSSKESRSPRSDWFEAGFQASALQTVSSRPSRFDRSTSFEERDDVMRALRSYITERGGRVLLAGRDSSDFGLGFPIKCDLIETTHSLVIEMRSPNRHDSRFLTEVVGKAVLLRDYGFKYVLCFLSPPSSKLDVISMETARRYGAAVIWHDHFPLHESDTAGFAGDPIF